MAARDAEGSGRWQPKSRRGLGHRSRDGTTWDAPTGGSLSQRSCVSSRLKSVIRACAAIGEE